jgi:hypothetical protein
MQLVIPFRRQKFMKGKVLSLGVINPVEISGKAPVDRLVLSEKTVKIHNVFLGKDQSWELTGGQNHVLVVVAQGVVKASINGEQKELYIGDWVTFVSEQKATIYALCDAVLVVVE